MNMDPAQFALELFYGLAKFALAFLMCAIVLSKAGANFKKNQQVRFHHEGFWKVKYAIFLLAGLIVAAWLDAPLRDGIQRVLDGNLLFGTICILAFSAILYAFGKKERVL
jgi:hypothetical protein